MPIIGTTTSTLTRPRISRNGDLMWPKHTLGATVVPMDAITENTVVNASTLTSHSGMISIKAVSPMDQATIYAEMDGAHDESDA